LASFPEPLASRAFGPLSREGGVTDDCSFPVGRGSNAVRAMFITSTDIASVVGLLYTWSDNGRLSLQICFSCCMALAGMFVCQFVWNALRHWGQILLAT